MRQNDINLEGLDEIFRQNEQLDREINEKRVDFDTEIDYNDAIDALKKNIHNANQLLEKIQDEMNNGNFSARLAEVAGSIINSVTQASKEIIQDKNYGEYLEIRRQLTELKEKELLIKEQKLGSPRSQTNVLVTSREDLLKVLENKKPKQIEEKQIDAEVI